MKIQKYVDFDFYFNNIKVKTVQQILQKVSHEIVSHASVGSEIMEDICIARMSNGGVCVKDGIAIFDLTSKFIKRQVTIIATINNKIGLQTADNKDIDLFVGVLSPSNNISTHLQKLSSIVRIFHSKTLCKSLRNSSSADEMKALFVPPQDWMIAA